MPDTGNLAVLAALIGLIVILWLVARSKTVTVYEFQRGLRYRDGRFTDLVGPGRYRIWGSTTTIATVDVRSTMITIAGRELVTSDGITVKVSLSVQARLTDPVKAMLEVEDHREAMYSFLQIALREVVGGLTGEEVLAKRSDTGA